MLPHPDLAPLLGDSLLHYNNVYQKLEDFVQYSGRTLIVPSCWEPAFELNHSLITDDLQTKTTTDFRL